MSEETPDKFPEWYLELHQKFEEVAYKYELYNFQVLSFLTLTLSGQMALSGCSENKVDQALIRVKEKYLSVMEKIEKDGK